MKTPGAGKLALLCSALLLVVITIAYVIGDREIRPLVTIAVALLMFSIVSLAVAIALSPEGTLDNSDCDCDCGVDDDCSDCGKDDHSLL